jgi:Flp pilus assembly protein TadG
VPIRARAFRRHRIGSEPIRRSASTRGQSLLEFALVLPLLVTVMIAGIDLARYAAIHSAAESASREATRYGSASGLVAGTPRYINCSGIAAAARNAAPNLSLAYPGNITIAYERWDAAATPPAWVETSPVCPPALGDAGIERMDRIVVTVTTGFSPMVGLLQGIDVVSTDRRSILKTDPGP